MSSEAVIERPFPLPLGSRLVLAWLSRLYWGRVEGNIPGGEPFSVRGAAPGPAAVMHLHAPWRLLSRAVRRGTIGFAESYMAGDWSSPEPATLLELMAVNEDAFERRARATWLGRAAIAAYHRRNRNTRSRSRRNIAAHYDLGNEFYRLWLDGTMTYSGAVFETDDQPLEAAQSNKYRAILERLAAGRGEHILEIGCGWGGFAVEAARRGARVTGVTLSGQQLAHARGQAATAGLGERVEIRLQDYRDIDGVFDHVVSIEMLEAVGEAYWPVYFDTLARSVRPGGRIVLHGITIEESRFEDYRRDPDFIQRYIFPGGMLPTRGRLLEEADRVGLETETVDTLGDHYAHTLRHWQRRLLDNLDAIHAQGFDNRFVRMWRFYLAYCEAAFRTGRTDLQRLVLRKPAVAA